MVPPAILPPQPVDPQALQKAQATLAQPTWDDIINRLRDDRQRTFTIDIETDSTIAQDEVADKQAVTEYLQAISQFVTSWLPIIQAQPELLSLACALLKAATKRFKFGREVESEVDEACEALEQAAKQPKPPAPDPKAQAAQIQAAATVQKATIEGQIAQQESQSRMQIEAQESAAKQSRETQELSAHMQMTNVKAQAEMERAAAAAMAKHTMPIA